MIVIDNKEPTAAERKATTHKESLEDLFRKELDAYCAYKEWKDSTEDKLLESALEEIMLDEFLHARFLRDYMMSKNMYSLSDTDPHEMNYYKIERKIFDD